MRSALYAICVAWIGCLIACKKDPVDISLDVPNIDSLHQSVIYKTIATEPSPADSVKGLSDSLSYFRSKSVNDEYLSNIPYVSAYNHDAGFSFSYEDPNKFLPYFIFTNNAFPDVPRDFPLNKTYEHISSRNILKPLFLGSHTGNDGMTYFIDNMYPPDAISPSSKTYTSIIFTKKIKIPLRSNSRDTALFGSGHISGYCIDYYNTDTTRYVNRWDFTVDFTDLRILE